MSYEHIFLTSLLITLVSEVSITVLLIKYLYKKREIKIYKVIFAGFVASTLTLPYFWFILPAFVSNRGVYVWVGEIAIILIESLIYNQVLDLNFKKSFIISLIANIVSIIFGLLIF